MKTKTKGILKSLLSLMLVASMTFAAPLSTWATSGEDTAVETTGVKDINGDGKLTYVTFGDSVTNGYGMEGYRYDDGTNPYGFHREVETAHPAIVAEYLSGVFDGEVELYQMAISGYRVEEFNYLLNTDVVRDEFHNKTVAWRAPSIVEDWYRKRTDSSMSDEDKAAMEAYINQYCVDPSIDDETELENNAQAIMANEYCKAVEAADVITLNLGANNFGTFLTWQLGALLGMDYELLDLDFTQFMDENTYKSVNALLTEMIGGVAGDDEQSAQLVKVLADTLLYGFLGATSHYDAAVETIYELNPDVQIVTMDVFSMISGITMEGESLGTDIDIIAIYDLFIDLVNLYTRELSPYASKTTHATVSETPEVFFDLYKNYPNEEYPDNQYLDPTAERLMNEFIMTFMGYDVNSQEGKDNFQKDVLDNITLMDSYVNNLQAVVTSEVIEKQVVPGIKSKIQEAVDGVDLVIDGVAQAKSALDGVETAQAVVDIVVDEVVGNSMFSTQSFMKNIVIYVIKSNLEERDLTEYGFENTDEDIAILAEVIYEVAVIYQNAIDDGKGEEEANRLALIEVMCFFLESKGDEDPEGNAELGYELHMIKLAEGEDAAIKAAISSKAADETQETLALQIYELYKANNVEGAEASEVREATIIALVASQIDNDAELAKAMYAVYTDKATDVQKQIAYIAALVTAGASPETAASIYKCYAEKLDGQIEEEYGVVNEDVKATMLFLMEKGLGMTPEAADSSYTSYVSYKRMPETLHRIASNDTMYFDTILANGIDMDTIGAAFMAGTLSLVEPVKEEGMTEAEYKAALDKFQYDSTVAILYLRFISQDGVYIHPSENGQKVLANAVIEALENVRTEAGLETYDLEGKKILTIGDSIAKEASDGNYTSVLAEMAGSTGTTFAYDGLRINEIRALLDSNYAGDDYTTEIFKHFQSAGYTEEQLKALLVNQIKSNEVVLVNLGAMNMGFIAAELEKYTSDPTSTYKMDFSTVSNMSVDQLGSRVNALLSGIQGDFTDTVSSVGMLMLAFESYGYGYTTFIDCFSATIEAIKALNPDAEIVLVGQYDLVGDAIVYDSESGMYFEFGAFIKDATDMMNGYMENYADMNENCIFVSMDGVKTHNAGTKLNLADSANIVTAMENAHPTSDEQKEMASRIYETVTTCPHDYEDTWEWADDYSTATFKYACSNEACEVKSVEATVTESNVVEGSCTASGSVTYTAKVIFEGKEYTDTKTTSGAPASHTYGEPVWEWSDDFKTAKATFECSKCDENVENHKIVIEAEKITSETTIPATCVEKGEMNYTATVTMEGETFTNVQKAELPATGEHTYGEDHICTVCNAQDPVVFGSCETKANVELTSGKTLVLALNGTEVGSYTFEEVSGGWAIKNADGKYLALDSNGALTTSDSAFAWTYADGRFSAVVKTESSSSSSSNNWFSSIFGGSFGSWFGSNSGTTTTETTYYLVASGSTVGTSTSNTGAAATFYEVKTNATHTFGTGVVTAPTCTTTGYTTHTCINCGYSYQDSFVDALGHNLNENGECTNEGCTEGKQEPEAPCTYLAEVGLVSGNAYVLKLGGNAVGTYTFTQVNDGWSIMNADGKYISVDASGNLATSDSAFAWTYANGRFSADVKTSSSSSSSWFSSIFGNLFGSSSSTKTYYLAASGSSLTASTSTTNTAASFYQETSGEHVYGEATAANGKHIFTCQNCGNVKEEVCNEATCELCNPPVVEKPAAVINVAVKITESTSSSSSSSSWFSSLFGSLFGSSKKTTYTATITVTAENATVDTVAYSTDGGSTWTTGTSFTSDSEITTFDIRVKDTDGNTYLYTYANGSIVEK